MCVCDVQEEDYEWGGNGTESYVSSLAEPLAKLARAAQRWRVNLSEVRRVRCHIASVNVMFTHTYQGGHKFG